MRAWLLAGLLIGCGGDGGDAKDSSSTDGPPRDAAIDAPPDAPTAVRRVDPCPANPARTVTTTDTPNYAFVPNDTSIKVNEVVKFAPGSLHNVIPHPTLPSDPGLRSGATGEARCLVFTEVGNFNYRCSPHAIMTGVVRVTN